MTYELAKQLKDAGFKIKPKPWQLYVSNGDGDIGLEVPTLSVLIEACGDKFHELHHCTRNREWRWTAYVHEELPRYEYDGSTPEEAVAKLYIALNAK